MSQSMNALLWFAAVVALIPLALWLLKRSPIGAGAGSGQHLRQVAVLPLSPQQRLVTVEVGSGDDRQWLVLGVTSHQITTLHTMAPQSTSPDESTVAKPAFANVLQRMRQAGGEHGTR